MRQHKIDLIVFLVNVRLVVLKIGSLRKLLRKSGTTLDFTCVVAPGFLVEAVVEVFVHVLLPVIVPRFWIGFKVVPIYFRD